MNKRKISFVLATTILIAGCALKSYETTLAGPNNSRSSTAGTPSEVSYGNGDKYIGDTVAGRPQGDGKLHFANGDNYQGKFANGAMSGQGTLRYKDGTVLSGVFIDDAPSTQHAFTLAGNRFFKGEFKNRQPYKGELTTSDGNRYTGEFTNGKLNGHGQLLFKSGESYSGLFTNGARDGIGVSKRGDSDFVQGWKNGALIYEGPGPLMVASAKASSSCQPLKNIPFKDYVLVNGNCDSGTLQGPAIIAMQGSAAYVEGDFKDGMLTTGLLARAHAGTIYEGSWNQQAAYHGLGAAYSNNEIVYQGQFVNGSTHGKGYCLHNKNLEPCETINGERSDQLHLMRLEQKRIQAWENSCNNAQNNLDSYAKKMVDALNNFCGKAYADIDGTVDWVFKFKDTMYYSTMDGGSKWIEASVDEARDCKRAVIDNIRFYDQAMANAEATLKQQQCPGRSQISQYQQLRRNVVTDADRQASRYTSSENEYIQLERKTRGKVLRRIRQESAQMWTDAISQFQNDMQNFSREMSQVSAETARLTSQAYSSSNARKQEQQRIQQQAYQTKVQQFKTGYAANQKRKLNTINAQVAAKNKMIDNRIAAEKASCIQRGHSWNDGGNNCLQQHNIKVHGLGTTEWQPGSAVTGIYQNPRHTGAVGSGQVANSSQAGASARNTASDGMPTGSSARNSVNSASNSDCTGQQMENCTRLIPVFVQDYENPQAWQTEDAACKYASAAAIRVAEKQCRDEFGGRKAYTSETSLPVHASCTSCREIKSGWSKDILEYKCMSTVNMQCKLP
jgi:hypothetical protein